MKNIVLVSTLCDEEDFNKTFTKKNVMPGQQIQKFNRLLVEGLMMNKASVTIVSSPPITNKNFSKLYLKIKNKTINNIKFEYLFLLNIPILKNLFILLGTFIKILKLKIKFKGNLVVISDVLNVSNTLGAKLACDLFKVKRISIITDLPKDVFKGKYSLKLSNKFISSSDGYVFISSQMGDLININKKPNVIIEGMVDFTDSSDVTNKVDSKIDGNSVRIVLYTGMVTKKYGLDNLVHAFDLVKNDKIELHIYGNGDFVSELSSNNNPNVRYFGVVQSKFMKDIQRNADILINPRPSNDEFTKYSFPSKNMEYMLSGTPVLTTKLPAMPLEYLDYVYILNDETSEGIAKKIEMLVSLDYETLQSKGVNARNFVLLNKNNKIMTKKIINLIQEL